MKNKILFLTIAAVGALLITASNGFAYGSYGDNVNAACAPASPYTGGDCDYCHTGGKSDPTEAKDAYSAGGTTLTDYFCPTQPACNDSDGDGYGNPVDSSCRYSAEDCDDTDASINPGAEEDCTDNIDNNCNGKIDEADPDAVGCPIDCTDNDGDFYSLEGGQCGSVDCNDAEPLVNPGVSEDCTDGIDNDCDDQTDCNDSACSGDPACVAESCADYTDRGSCKADSRCNWSGKLKECFEPVVYTQSECDAAGGRWNKKKETCTIR